MKQYVVQFKRGTGAADRQSILTGLRATRRNAWRDSWGRVVQAVDIPDENAEKFEEAMEKEAAVDHWHQK